MVSLSWSVLHTIPASAFGLTISSPDFHASEQAIAFGWFTTVSRLQCFERKLPTNYRYSQTKKIELESLMYSTRYVISSYLISVLEYILLKTCKQFLIYEFLSCLIFLNCATNSISTSNFYGSPCCRVSNIFPKTWNFKSIHKAVSYMTVWLSVI